MLARLRLSILSLFVTLLISCGGGGNNPETEVLDDEGTAPTEDTSNDVEVDAAKCIEELDGLMKSSGAGADTTPFEDTELGKNGMSEVERAELATSFAAVLDETDPAPEWFSTKLSKEVIVTTPGETYSVTVEKARADGSTIAPVLPNDLKLVVVIQRSKNDFELISEANQAQYANWTSTDGILEVTVPNNLTQGRLLIGFRPNFGSDSLNEVGERLSNVVSLEVW